MKKHYSISVIVPVYNEIQLLKKSLYEIDNFLKNNFNDYEIIIIESGSTDGSKEACDRILNDLPCASLIHENKKNGFGSALKLGYEKATKDLIWSVTVDLPFRLETILEALPLFSEYDCVLSYRSKDDRRLGRKFQSVVYNHLVRLLLGLEVKHINSSFKVFKKETIKNISLISKGWFIDAEIIYRLEKQKVPYTQIPVELLERKIGKSTINFITFISVLKEFSYFLKYQKEFADAAKS